jgi:hypothetical protein
MREGDQGGGGGGGGRGRGKGMRRGREGNGERKKRRTGKSPTPPSPLTTDHPQDPHSLFLHTPAVKDGQNDNDDTVVVVCGT